MPTAVEESKKTAAKLTLPLKNLQHALATVVLAADRKSTIPVLGNVRVEQTDACLEFSGTNLDLAIRYRMPHPGKAAEPFLLPAFKLDAFAKLLEGEQVSLTSTDGTRATLRCGRSTTKLPMMEVTNFPNISVSEDESGLRIPQDLAARLFDFTTFAISQEESRYTLNGALLEVSGGKLCMVATDGHRLTRYTVETSNSDTLPMLVPASLLKVIDKVIHAANAAPVYFSSNEANVFANVSGDGYEIALAHHKMTGQFPNYKAVIPAAAAVRLAVDSESMLHSLRRCATFTDDRSGCVVLTVGPEMIQMRAASADVGETDEPVDVKSFGDAFEPFKVGFCVDYLVDAFSRLKGGATEIRFEAASGQKPMVLHAAPAEDELFEYVVMPMRV